MLPQRPAIAKFVAPGREQGQHTSMLVLASSQVLIGCATVGHLMYAHKYWLNSWRGERAHISSQPTLTVQRSVLAHQPSVALSACRGRVGKHWQQIGMQQTALKCL